MSTPGGMKILVIVSPEIGLATHPWHSLRRHQPAVSGGPARLAARECIWGIWARGQILREVVSRLDVRAAARQAFVDYPNHGEGSCPGWGWSWARPIPYPGCWTTSPRHAGAIAERRGRGRPT